MRDEPHARPDQLAARDPRQRAARGARLLRSARRLRAVPAGVRHRSSPPTARAAPSRARRHRRPRSAPATRRRAAGRATPAAAASGGLRARGPGTKILEFGSGAAGPIATRYFVEHGATVLRVESKSRPDFLRVYALGPEQPARARGRADVRRPQRRQARRHVQPEAPEGRRARAPARRRVGRRGRRELRATGDARLRPRLRRRSRRTSPTS